MKYNVSNMQIDYNDLDLKDVGLGRIFCLEKSNDSYIVTAFGATSI